MAGVVVPKAWARMVANEPRQIDYEPGGVHVADLVFVNQLELLVARLHHARCKRLEQKVGAPGKKRRLDEYKFSHHVEVEAAGLRLLCKAAACVSVILCVFECPSSQPRPCSSVLLAHAFRGHRLQPGGIAVLELVLGGLGLATCRRGAASLWSPSHAITE